MQPHTSHTLLTPSQSAQIARKTARPERLRRHGDELVDIEEYKMYDQGLEQFFEGPLQPETLKIIEENDEAYKCFVHNQNQQMFLRETIGRFC